MLGSQKIVAFLVTTDYARARQFYEGMLGLEFISQDPFAMVLRAGENTIRVVKAENFTPAQGTVLGWEVADIEKTVRGLQSRGLQFEQYPFVQDSRGLGIWTAPGGDQVAWFKDPDGNVLSLSQHHT
jgi:catechol 2,3-dioxygenase-like lactoylglutathione lyase family enzyme